jgi:hypothetical protein
METNVYFYINTEYSDLDGTPTHTPLRLNSMTSDPKKDGRTMEWVHRRVRDVHINILADQLFFDEQETLCKVCLGKEMATWDEADYYWAEQRFEDNRWLRADGYYSPIPGDRLEDFQEVMTILKEYDPFEDC